MNRAFLILLVGLGLATSACSDRAATPAYDGPQIAINVAPFEIDAVTNARYRLTVRNAENAVVWQREVTADAYGDGHGSVAYVGPCDAQSNPNKVSVEVLDLYKGTDGTTPFDTSLYGLPGEISRDVTCLANEDVAVQFDITILIDPPDMPAFLSIGVGFDDIFCSAKLDCLDSNGDPLKLLFNADGARAQTAVVALACTAGADAATVLYRSNLAIHCDDNGVAAGGTVLDVTVDPSKGPGNLSTAVDGGISGSAGVLFAAQVSAGDELIANYNKAYWNVLLGLEPGAKGCTLTATATANDGRWPADTIPAGQVWPYIDWNVDLTDTSGALLCTTHPVGGAAPDHDGVSALYTDGSAVVWSHAYVSAHVTPPAAPGLGGLRTTADPGRWLDGTYAAACDAYRFPTDGHTYTDATGDGVYAIDPDGGGPNAPFNAYCDMTTSGGGWTLVAQSRPSTDAALSLCASGAVSALDLDATTVSGPAKLDNAVINALWSTGTEQNLLIKGDQGGYAGTTASWTRGCILDFQPTFSWKTDNTVVLGDLETTAYTCPIGTLGDGVIDSLHPMPAYAAITCGYGFRDGPSEDYFIFTFDTTFAGGACAGTAGRTWLGQGNEGCNLSKVFVRDRSGLVGAFTEADPGRWADGTLATSCQTYREPGAVGAHTPATRSGVYRIDPDGAGLTYAPFTVYCDMVTAGGGWTLVAQARPNAAVDICATTAAGTLDLDPVSYTSAAKLSDDTINAIWATGTEHKVLAASDVDAWGPTAVVERACILDFKAATAWTTTTTFPLVSDLDTTTVSCPVDSAAGGVIYAIHGGSNCGFGYEVNVAGSTSYFMFTNQIGYAVTLGACALGGTNTYGRSWLGAGNYGCTLTKTYVR